MNFADYDDLARHLGITTQEQADAELDAAVASQMLAGASDQIRAVCGWSVTQETVADTVDVDCGAKWLFLPTLHLTAFALSVTPWPLMTPTPWLDTDYQWQRNGSVKLFRHVPYRAMVSVAYTHGYPVIPAGLRQVCCELAAATLVNPRQLSSVTVGNVSEVYQRYSSTTDQPEKLSSDPRVAAYVLPVVG